MGAISKNKTGTRSTNLSVDELHVVWALGITISGSVLRSSLVRSVLGHATVGIHGGEVDSSVESTWQVRHIDVEGELLALQAEHLVFGVIGHEVDSASDVLLCARGHEFEGQGVTSAVDTVGAGVVSSLHGAVGGTCGGIGAESSIPGVSGVAVGEALGRVKPAPVRVEDDLGLLGGAAAGRALLRSHGRVGFGDIGSNLLGLDTSEDREDDGEFAVHREEWTESEEDGEG